jgi:ABC-type multidrug transport system ATPase subunit
MSESVLNALVRLFALIGDIQDETLITRKEKEVVRSFLARNLNNELVNKYMKMFEEYLTIFNTNSIIKDSLAERKRTTLNSVRVLGICEEINQELRQEQKVYVIVQLIDYIALGQEVSENELDFLRTASSAFYIDQNDYKNIENFIMRGIAGIPEKRKVLVIDNSEVQTVPEIKHRYCEFISGDLSFLHIHSTDTFIFRYSGDQDIYLNGLNISAGQTYIFDRGSSLRGPGIRTIYYTEVAGMITGTSNDLGIRIEATDVRFRFSNSDNGIQRLNFHEVSGSLVGIMGGSGVGKSTTLSVLSGTLKPQGGTILINGFNLYDEEENSALKGVIGFVPQDDLLIEELTVFQNLFYSAKLCLNNLPEEKITEVVNKTLLDFDLYDTRDLKVGNPLKKVISGGQRKRLNIALELLREPTILFVDEPTSGLSSVDSEMVMNLLKAQAYKGKLVVVNIHQPSSEIYKMFDKIMIIDKGGYQAFYGNPNEAIIYFKHHTRHANPEEDQCVKCGNINTDQLLQIIEAKVIDEHGRPTRTRKVSPREWADRFREYSENSGKKGNSGRQALPSNNFSIPGLRKQSGIFFTRDLLSKLANKQFLLISLLGPPLLAILLAYFTRNKTGGVYIFEENYNIPAFLFMCIITSLFFGLMISSEEIVKDRKLLKRESFLNLSWLSYLNSKVAMMFIISAIQTMCFALIGSAILGIKGMTMSTWLVLFTTSCFGNLMGLTISSAFNSVITIYILIPFIIIPQLLFSGVLVPFEKLNRGDWARLEYVPLIGDAMPGRWAYEALATRQLRHNEFDRITFDLDMEASIYACQVHLIDRISQLLKTCGGNVKGEYLEHELGVINFYIDSLSSDAGLTPGPWRANIVPGKMNKKVYEEAKLFLDDSLKTYFSSLRGDAERRKDFRAKRVRDSIGEEKWNALRSNYSNRKLKELILLSGSGRTFIEAGDRIIPFANPGYTIPASTIGRAHFYAPVKILGKMEVETFKFDVIVLWVITGILYILLYFKVLARVINGFENMRFQKAEV